MSSEQFPFPHTYSDDQPQDAAANVPADAMSTTDPSAEQTASGAEPLSHQSPSESAESLEAPLSVYEQRGQRTLDAYSASAEQTKKPNLLTDKARKILKGVALTAATLFFVVTLSACGAGTNTTATPAPDAPVAPTFDVDRMPDSAETPIIIESFTGYDFLDERIDGSFNQYDAGGHDCSYAKGDPVLEGTDAAGRKYPDIHSKGSFANMGYLLTLMRDENAIKDSSNITADEYGIAEKYIAFREKEKSAFIAVSNNLEGFEGLSYKAAITKIGDMDPFEKQEFQAKLQDYFENTDFSVEEVSGSITNHYIEEDAKGDKVTQDYTDYIEGSVRTLVSTYHGPDGKDYITRALLRCDNPFLIVTVVDRNTGEKTEVVVNRDDPVDFPPATSTPETGQPQGGDPNTTTGQPQGGDPNTTSGEPQGGDPSTETTPPTTTTPPETTPPETTPPETPPPVTTTPAPKDTTAEKENAGPDVTQLPLDNNVTPPTTQEQAQANFQSVQDQQAAEQAAREAAARRAAEQAAAEEAARQEAARRAAEEAERQQQLAAQQAAEEAERQRQAAEAARRAEEEAAARQQAAAEAERRRQEEEAARAAAQAEADRRAAEEAAAAAANANATADDRANLFNNGDF